MTGSAAGGRTDRLNPVDQVFGAPRCGREMAAPQEVASLRGVSENRKMKKKKEKERKIDNNYD